MRSRKVRSARSRPPRAAADGGAFTLVELLTVIGIVSLLVTILMPSLGTARELGRMAKCKTNLRAIIGALFNYARNNDDYLPPGEYTGDGTWATVLVDRSYVDAPKGAGPTDLKLGSSPFQCPTGEPIVTDGTPSSPDDIVGATAVASQLGNGQYIHNWYGVNGSGDPNKYIMNLNAGVKLGLIRRTGDTIAVFDGRKMHNGNPNNVNARHVNRSKTNVLLLSQDAVTLERSAPDFPDLTNSNATPRFAINK